MPSGRKAQYSDWLTDDGLLIIRGWARDGFSDKQIAHNIGVCETTFKEWKKRFSAISDSLKKGRMPVAYRVEEALYSRCEWRKVTETTRRYQTDIEGNIISESIEYEEKSKWIPPDTTAMIFASKNLMPHKFRDKPVYVPTEDVEDDGLIDALKSQTALFADGDDSAMVNTDEGG